MLRRWSLRIAVLSLANDVLLGSGKSVLCNDGECLNCRSCSGDCTSRCRCFGEVNTCCCPAPVGSFARGYGQIPCPGGTFQDSLGRGHCRPCNDTADVLYNLSKRGATSTADCRKAICTCTSASQQQACDQECVTAAEVVSKMNMEPEALDFCDRLDIKLGSCSWRYPSSAHRGGGADLLLMVALLGLAMSR
eukprot:TRINITY_DN77371_c0_g1_i1.p1 TRINITY_DN77371_c0_g1~~TRINITY_DN77371_c0_g1_i1.p1  ORF type:complete len:192 (-),score=33.94 TRINITY_DN77371_c0_g1_i1:64-639(-)